MPPLWIVLWQNTTPLDSGKILKSKINFMYILFLDSNIIFVMKTVLDFFLSQFIRFLPGRPCDDSSVRLTICRYRTPQMQQIVRNSFKALIFAHLLNLIYGCETVNEFLKIQISKVSYFINVFEVSQITWTKSKIKWFQCFGNFIVRGCSLWSLDQFKQLQKIIYFIQNPDASFLT